MKTAAAPEIVSVDEVIQRYPNEWIFMQVTAEDEFHAPSHGLILAHHPKRGWLQRSILKKIEKRRDKSVQYYVFQAYPRSGPPQREVEDLEEQWLKMLDRIMCRDVTG